MRSRVAVPVLFVLLAALFVAGILHLFQLRFGAGDVYSPYSSLRADPLGTKAFHDSLAELSPLSVTRNLRPLYQLHSSPDLAVLVVGVDPQEMDIPTAGSWDSLRALAVGGSRVVVALAPTNDKAYWKWATRAAAGQATTSTASSSSPLSKEGMAERQEEEARERRRRSAGLDSASSASLTQSFGLRFAFHTLTENSEDGIQPEPARSPDEDSDTSIPWYSALSFKELPSEWDVKLERAGMPVAIERRFGTGSLVVMTDSYIFSNEAIQKHREPELLAWAIGNKTRVVFEETHHGIGEDPGIVSLARQYRLHGFAGGMFVLIGLFLWRSSSSFLPRHDEEQRPGALSTGRNAAAGLVHLLRRGVPRSDVLETCMQEWMKSRTGKRLGPGETSRVEQALAVAEEERNRSPRSRDPVTAYRRISTIMNERK